MLTTKRITSFVLVLLLASWAGSALAESAKQEAGRLFSEGNTLYDKGDYQGALEKFEAARARYPSYKIDLNVATVLVDLGRQAKAAETYEIFLQRGAALAPPSIVASARAKLDELRIQLARVSVSCPVDGAALKVDGETVGSTPRRWPVYLKPGEHRVEACKDGYTCGAETLTVAAGDQREIALKPEEQGTTGAGQTTEPVGGGDQTPTVTRTADRKTDWKPTAGWVAVGVGGAALITGVIFGVMVKSKQDEYNEEGKTFGERQEIADDGKRFQNIELATLVVGGVALAAGGGLLLWHYLGKRKKSSEPSTAYVAPLLSKDVHGLVGGLQF